MRIHCFSPLPPARTDIANATARILPALARRAEVTIWTYAHSWDSHLDTYAAIRAFHGNELPWPELNAGDATVYMIGNNPRFHGAFTEILAHHRGHIILHDTNLHELYRSWLLEKRDGWDRYNALMFEQGGADALQLVRDHENGHIPFETITERFPLTHVPISDALGAIVHSNVAYEQLRTEISIPTSYLPLPYKEQSALRPFRHRASRTIAHGERYRIIIFGFLHGQNRRLLPVLKALAKLDRRASFRLDIAGEVPSEQHLIATLTQLGIDNQTTYHGFVADEALDKLLSEADLAINLRYPSLGESSGSQLRIWDHSLPSIVTRTGWYSSIPPDCVSFVDPQHEEEDLLHLLTDFLEDPRPYFEQGRSGHAHLAAEHSAENYVAHLLDFIAATKHTDGVRFIPRFAHHVAQTALKDLDHPGSRDHLLTRVSHELAMWGKIDATSRSSSSDTEI